MAAAPSPFASVRLADVPTGPITTNPIPGLRDIPRVLVEAAMEFVVPEDREWARAMPDLRANLRHAQAFATNFLNGAPPGEPLSREEIIGLHMYTMDSPFFRILNARLRSENRDLLRPYLIRAVLAIDADVAKGLIVVACSENRVERTGDRTGQIVWKRTDLNSPYAAVVAEDVVLVTENGGARVTRLEKGSGMTRSTFGEGTLKGPTGIAVAANGDIVVADWTTKQVHVFDGKGNLLRSLGQGRLQNPHGMSVDGRGRVYVADYNSCTVVVLDGVSDAVLATIAAGGNAFGVAVTDGGQIVASVMVGDKGWLGTKRRGMLSVIGSCSSETTV
jgi:YVTN family beta-propeller protein